MSEVILPAAGTRLSGKAGERLRLAVFVAIAAFIIGAPTAVQMFGARSSVLRPWIMFSTPGLGVVDASFMRMQADGTLRPLDRFVMLGEPRDGRMRRIESRDELASIVKRLCDAAGPAADIRVKARQATRAGWYPIEEATVNVCAR
ncbi:MAG: hypothetical protein JNL61_20010 [Rhizobiaceae bacterium]|nr:hypothetical protein [Rhizobiaceae bacterium]